MENYKKFLKGNRLQGLGQKVLETINNQPNNLVTTSSLMRKYMDYNENEIYQCLRVLTAINLINKETIQHKSYYWARRDEIRKEVENVTREAGT